MLESDDDDPEYERQVDDRGALENKQKPEAVMLNSRNRIDQVRGWIVTMARTHQEDEQQAGDSLRLIMYLINRNSETDDVK
ncbi:hypothetical protein AVEN_31118-1 [Araneus ventricosus]|uniref:Uncharacterized protein n=1 Tax=Araneus ventricosus TaxID=182803 RepID=A0A4Y2VGB7_ARAVE|nr:hypothetical protein AVEN_31118-1 [Araneus ventricosus]